MAHEFGHYIGLGHAGGASTLDTLDVTEYGDTSATMGNDILQLNSLTAPARYFVGALPEQVIKTDFWGVARLRALTLQAAADDDAYSAVAWYCSDCISKNARYASSSNAGLELWVSFRGDATTCRPVVANAHVRDFDCHRDHDSKYGQVHIHARLADDGRIASPRTEEWARLPRGLTWTNRWYIVQHCNVTSDTESATVVVESTRAGADAACALEERRDRGVAHVANVTELPPPPATSTSLPPPPTPLPPSASVRVGSSAPPWAVAYVGFALAAAMLVLIFWETKRTSDLVPIRQLD